ncbi:MAG TPA: hypothetical protein VIG99_32855 [Myxococcaceae bacterium]|jgi:hypothetical protein
MYVVRNKKTKAIIHMVNSTPGVDLKPEEVFQGFDPKAMELGRFSEQYLPSKFTIEDGVVISQEKAPNEELDVKGLKAQKLSQASSRAFVERQKLIPDHEMLNAALGVYPEKRTRQIQETVKAFREEYKRFEAALEKARSRKDVETLEPKFPTKLVSASGGESK